MRRGGEIAVQLLIGEPALADRIAVILAGEAGLQIVEDGDPEAPGPDVTLADALPDAEPSHPVILIADRVDALAALNAGAAGVLASTAGVAQIVLAIRGVAAGLAVLPAQWNVLDEPATATAAGTLTTRELNVLRLLASGASNKVIARELAISVHTVKFHVASILAKLNATGRTEAVVQAARLGLLML